MQKTITRPVSETGIGLHSGKKVSIRLFPGNPDSGIVFIRNGVKIPALAHFVSDTKMSTTLSNEGQKIQTVEHIMSAIAALGIDNLEIHCSEDEMPIMDGSSLPFVLLLKEAGIRYQKAPKKLFKITKPVEVWFEDKMALILPSETTSYTCEIEFSHPLINRQSFELKDFSSYNQSISKSRTFGFIQDLEKLQSRGLALGGSVNNAIVLDEYSSLNDLRYEDEFVRHKILDAIGDMRLLGGHIVGKFYSYKGGHHLNNLLCKKILEMSAFEIFSSETVDNEETTVCSYA